jgi:hypothetical protein
MELFLNSAWAAMAIVTVCLWLRLDGRGQGERRVSLVALVMLIVILFPVISVSDDLWSLQNPAETDTCQRRDHLASCAHSMFAAGAALPLAAPTGLSADFQHLALPPMFPQPAVENPALEAIQNRPPPSA